MRRKENRKTGGFGTFIFGTFIGFLLCLGALAGLGCFIYFKVSPAWINKTFKTDIDLGSDEINNKTLKDLVENATGLVKNIDTYTLDDLQKDFGVEIEDELFGLDITDLKTVGLSDLPNAVEKMFGSISANELKNINGMNLSEMSTILDKTNTYYFNETDNKLYKKFDGINYSNPVNFDYEVNDAKTKITTKKHATQIKRHSEYAVVNQVDIQLWYLPLTDALGGFTSNMGNQMTLKDLETDFGVQLPSFLDKVDKQNTTINELEDAINNLYVADFLGYTINDSNPANIIVKNNGEDVTGIMYELAIEKIENLGSVEDKFNSLTAADLEGTIDLTNLSIFNKSNTYYINNNLLYKDSSYNNEVEFEYEVKGLNVVVENQSFAISSGKVNIALKYLPLATAISDFTSNMGNTLTLRELKEDYGVVLPEYIYKNNETKTINEIETIIDNILVADVLGYTIDRSDKVWDGTTEVTGIMAIIAKKKVCELNDIQLTIEGETIATLMNYTIVNGEVYNGETKVDGLLGKVAKYTINNVGNAVNDLELSDVFSSAQLSDGVFKLLDQATVGSVKVINVANELKSAMENSSMADLQDAGVISDVYNLNVQIDTDLDGVKDSLMSEMTLNGFLEVALNILTR